MTKQGPFTILTPLCHVCLKRLPSHHTPHSSIPPSVHPLSFLAAPGAKVAHGSVQGADSDSSLAELGRGRHLSPPRPFSYLPFSCLLMFFILFSKLSALTLLKTLGFFTPLSIISPIAYHITSSYAGY